MNGHETDTLPSHLQGLSDVQLRAVTAVEGPSLIIAGAGSGKTRVLTVRIAHLLRQGVRPYHILALTFTNKAAREMKERIAQVVGQDPARGLWMGTFHSMFMRILRQESELIGFPKTFTVYDTTDSKSLIASIIKELKLDPQAYRANEVFARISAAKNNLITPQAYAGNAQLLAHDRQTRKPELAQIYALYAQRCQKASAMDFDDLLLYTNILLRDQPAVLAKYQDKFRYILVDEYQDTNYSQYVIVKRLAALHRNVCVVGDDAQSIYSFRGAKIENILNFRNDYPEYNLFKLEQNYRSTQTIVNAANSVIARNANQLHKVAYSANDMGERVRVLRAYTDQEEGFMVASAIEGIRATHRADYQDFAILYRTNAQSRIFEEALRKRNVPYRVYGSLSFFQRKEIKDLLAYFRLAMNPNDDEALKRIVNYPARGIGATTLERIEADASASQRSLWLTIQELGSPHSPHKPAMLRRLSDFQAMIRQFAQRAFAADAHGAALAIARDSGVLADLKADSSFEGIARLQNVEALLNGIREFVEGRQREGIADVSLAEYIESVALLTDADTDRPEDKNKVALMTIHSAKGLEFDYVFLAGVEEDLFPSRSTNSTPEELEEERRLFYVALTRAAKRATISYAQVRYKWGNAASCIPSRFIGEIDPQWVEMPLEQPAPAAPHRPAMGRRDDRSPRPSAVWGQGQSPGPGQPTHGPSRWVRPSAASANPTPQAGATDPGALGPGRVVEHERFGRGQVIGMEGEGQDAKATIAFAAAGEKTLLLRFARLRVIG